MADKSKFDALTENGTLAHDPRVGTDGLIDTLADWDARYGVEVSEAGPDRVMVTLASVPKDLDQFAEEVRQLCPDVVHEHFASFVSLAEYSSNPNFAKAIQGLDEMDDEFGFKAMKRWIKLERTLPLWWSE